VSEPDRVDSVSASSFPSRVGNIRLDEAMSADDAIGRGPDGSLVWVAFGNPRELDLERAAIERVLTGKASWLAAESVVAHGLDVGGHGYLALGQPYDAVPLSAFDVDLAPRIVAFLEGLLDLLAGIESAGQICVAEGIDIVRVDGKPRLRRLRGIRRARADERLDARTTIELACEQLPDQLLARLPADLLAAILPHRDRPLDADRSVEAVRAELGSIAQMRRVATDDERRIAVRRHIGLLRERNEDAGASAHLPDRAVLVVCDGVSASSRADVASALVARTVCERLSIARPGPESMAEAIRVAHRALLEEQRTFDSEPMGTTVVAACVHEGSITLGWVGDSRAYLLSTDDSHALTRDHSWLEEIVAAGLSSLDEALKSPLAHALTRCLGPMPGSDDSAHAEPEVAQAPRRSGYLVLCSDGLWNHFASADELSSMVGDLLDDAPAHALADRLLSAALARGGHDNVTVAVLRL
jgi:PPM family protein phosphatase